LAKEDGKPPLDDPMHHVYAWEQNQGALRVRASTRAAILAIRNLGAREARKRLEEMQQPARKPNKPRKAQKQGKAQKPASGTPKRRKKRR
jgi:hypothetical protein